MFSLFHGSQRGDTIVEVMFAIAVFAFLASSSLAIMNRGIATTQRSLETTQVRQAMNDQAELLRYAEQDALSGGNSQLWAQLISNTYAEKDASTYGLLTDGRCPTRANQLGSDIHPFIVDPTTMKIKTTALLGGSSSVAYPQLVYNANGGFVGSSGLWVESVPEESSHYVDFHIRACWDAPGSDVPSTLGTIVRLYAN